MKLKGGKKAILFDLDGTLIKSFDALNDSLISALNHCGHGQSGTDFFADLFGRSEADVLRDLGVPEMDIPEVLKMWTKYNQEHAGEINFFEGIPELLASLRAKGYLLGIATGRSWEKTRILPIAMQLAKEMDIYVTPDDTNRGKPHPDQILYALDKLGVSPEQAVYVGDSIYDIESAKRAGCESILVTYDGSNHINSPECNPSRIAGSVDELTEILSALD